VPGNGDRRQGRAIMGSEVVRTAATFSPVSLLEQSAA
jgi:hypothetical protein